MTGLEFAVLGTEAGKAVVSEITKRALDLSTAVPPDQRPGFAALQPLVIASSQTVVTVSAEVLDMLEPFQTRDDFANQSVLERSCRELAARSSEMKRLAEEVAPKLAGMRRASRHAVPQLSLSPLRHWIAPSGGTAGQRACSSTSRSRPSVRALRSPRPAVSHRSRLNSSLSCSCRPSAGDTLSRRIATSSRRPRKQR